MDRIYLWFHPPPVLPAVKQAGRAALAQIIYLQSASLLLGISLSYSSVRLVNQNAVSAPYKRARLFPARQKNSEFPDLNASLTFMSQARRLSQCHYSSPSSLRAALLAPLVLLAELLVSLILGCGVLFVVGAAEVSFCDKVSSSSLSSGCSCSCFWYSSRKYVCRHVSQAAL